MYRVGIYLQKIFSGTQVLPFIYKKKMLLSTWNYVWSYKEKNQTQNYEVLGTKWTKKAHTS